VGHSVSACRRTGPPRERLTALLRAALAQIARQLVHARVAAVGKITVARGLIQFCGSFVAVSRSLILVCRGLIAIRSCLIGVGESLIVLRAPLQSLAGTLGEKRGAARGGCGRH
jgi:hypothetical protein